jgi:CHAT domain-containing protein/tetratricopeptide (TPR) repeat protein
MPGDMSKEDQREYGENLLNIFAAALTAADRESLDRLPPVEFSPIVIPHEELVTFADKDGARQRLTAVTGMTHIFERAGELRLEVFTRADNPENWALGISDLGRSYFHRAIGDPAENIEAAIICLRQSLEVFTAASHPMFWAMRSADLSVLYGRRVGDDRSENRELALHYARRTLKIFTEKSNPEDHARSCTLIGKAYRDRLLRNRRENLSKAIAHYRKAREYYARQKDDRKCEWMDELLGQAYLLRAKEGSGGPRDATKAIKFLQSALRNINKLTDGNRWAGTAHNLALAQDFVGGNQQSDIEKSIERLQDSLALISREASPVQWADCQANIAISYLRLTRGYPDQFQAKGMACVEVAVGIYEEYGELAKVRDMRQLVGDTCFSTHQWLAAHHAYEAALSAGWTLYEAAFTERGRHHELARITKTISRDAYALVWLDRQADALECLERGRTQLLKEALVAEDPELAGMEDTQRAEIENTRAEIGRLEVAMRDRSVPGTNMREMAEQLKVARSRYRAAIADIRAARRHLSKSVSWGLEQILSEIPVGGAMIVPFQMSEFPSGAFVIPHGQKTVSIDDVVHLVQPFAEARARGHTPLFDPSAASRGSARNFAGTLQTLSTHVMDSVIERLTSFELAKGAPILVVGTAFETLGLHTAVCHIDDDTYTALDLFSMRYVPSTQLARICADRMKSRATADPSVIAVIDPAAELRYGRAEGFIIEQLFKEGRYLTVPDADVTAVRSATGGATYLHFACHGFHSREEPLQSALVLPDGTLLTAADIISSLDVRASRLVTLSACQSGLTDLSALATEYLGLPTAFLEAGAPSVLSTLWNVSDASTMLLMYRFYTEHLDSLAPASVALARAQAWLRDSTNAEFAWIFERILTQAPCDSAAYQAAEQGILKHPLSDRVTQPFADPYYWAPFILMGAEVPACRGV